MERPRLDPPRSTFPSFPARFTLKFFRFSPDMAWARQTARAAQSARPAAARRLRVLVPTKTCKKNRKGGGLVNGRLRGHGRMLRG